MWNVSVCCWNHINKYLKKITIIKVQKTFLQWNLHLIFLNLRFFPDLMFNFIGHMSVIWMLIFLQLPRETLNGGLTLFSTKDSEKQFAVFNNTSCKFIFVVDLLSLMNENYFFSAPPREASGADGHQNSASIPLLCMMIVIFVYFCQHWSNIIELSNQYSVNRTWSYNGSAEWWKNYWTVPGTCLETCNSTSCECDVSFGVSITLSIFSVASPVSDCPPFQHESCRGHFSDYWTNFCVTISSWC